MPHRRLVRLSAAIVASVVVSASLGAQTPAAPATPAAPPAPEVGQPAPNFSGRIADASGVKPKPVSLADYKGKVVVLGVSGDSLASHASWASEMKFPFALVSDPDLSIAGQYGSAVPGRKYASRTVFVVGKDGTLRYRELKFGALSEDAYKKLAEEVGKAKS